MSPERADNANAEELDNSDLPLDGQVLLHRVNAPSLPVVAFCVTRVLHL